MFELLRRQVLIPLNDRREHRSRLQYVKEVDRFFESTADEIRRYQVERITRLVRLAHRKVPFYRWYFDDQGVDAESVRDLDDVARLPIVTKDHLRRYNEEFVREDLPRDSLIKTGTGGTTSSPVDLFYTRECRARKNACAIHFCGRMGIRFGSRRALLWGAPQDIPDASSAKSRIKNFLTENTLYLFSSYLNDEVMADYHECLQRFRPHSLQAYPTPLYIFACFLERNDLRLEIPVIHVTAEKLHAHQREKIRKVFQVEPYEWYGARELGRIANECSEHRGLHINTYGVYLEVVRDGMPVTGELGSIVATDLLNEAMPIIRYQIGDLGILSHRACPCGSNLPLVDEVVGRHGDVFRKSDGTLVPGISFADRIVTECHGIEQIQIVQKDYRVFKLNLVKGTHYTDDDLRAVESLIESYMREPLAFTVAFVDDIPPEPSGKILFCKCEIAENAW